MSSLRGFVDLVAQDLGGSTRRRGNRFTLVLPDLAPTLVEPEPGSDGAGATSARLQYVEKQAAIVSLAAPVLFGAELPARRGWRSPSVLLRMAFVYRLCNGVPCSRRYTAYLEPGSGWRITIRGSDGLFGAGLGAVERAPDTSMVQTHQPEMAQLVTSTHDGYLEDPEVKSELEAIGERQRSELFELDLLYNRRSQRYLRTYGVNPETPWEPPSSPSEEFRRKRSIVHQRHQPLIAIDILSVGSVVTPARKHGSSMRFPFLQSA